MKQKAVALRWNPSLVAPVVVAKGEAHLAKKIIELAQEAGVTIVEDEWLPSLLMPLEVASEIPSSLYEAVAQILATIYTINNEGE